MINTVKIAFDHARSMGPPPEYSIIDLANMNVERVKYQTAWRELWKKHEPDVLVGPGAQHTTAKHDTYGTPGYTLIWNFLEVSVSLNSTL
jgi:hypothetical protein